VDVHWVASPPYGEPLNNFGSFNISANLPPAQPLYVEVGQMWQYIRIINKSSYMLDIDFVGVGHITHAEMYLEDYLVTSQFNGNIVITPTSDLTNTSQSLSKLVTVMGFKKGELPQPQAQPLTQQAVNVTASGKPLFSATFGWGPSAQSKQLLNIFNPPLSGVTMTFHAGRGLTAETTHPRVAMFYSPGNDLNLANPVAIQSHTGTANPPVSVGHATAVEQATYIGTVINEIESLDFATQPQQQDFEAFPDSFTLYPGGNLTLVMISSNTGNNVRLTLKWAEDQVVPPIIVLGAGAVAASIKNDGNSVGTQIIESTVLGDGTPAVLLTNDAQFTLGDIAHPGTFGGLFSFLAGINMQVPQASHAGSVSGSANLYEAMQGNVHFLFITLISYQDAADQELVIPHAFQNGIAFFQSGTIGVAGAGGMSVDNSGTLRTLAIITAIAAAGGGTTGQTGLFSASFAYLGGGTFNQVRILASGGVTRTGHVIIIGN